MGGGINHSKGNCGEDPELRTGRNLVVFLDGTGNELGRNLSNVLKLFRMCEKSAQQKCYYNPGVGTIGRINPWRRWRQRAASVLGLATGYGLDSNVLGAYRFLVENWREEDRIYLFGFSRGAWTVRVLAGFLHLVGLLNHEQINLCDSALGAYKRAASHNDLPFAWHFARVAGTRRPPIHFVGAWDSVGSVLVPRPDRFYIPSIETLPYTRTNPSVARFRHALSIDERRRMFRVAHWNETQNHHLDPSCPAQTVPQDIEQRWFAGVHSDIGGGYPEDESGLSKFALQWMAEEAVKAGLKVDEVLLRHLVLGEPHEGGQHNYVAPDATAPIHNSLTGAWRILEYFPKRGRLREGKKPAPLGFYFPRGEARWIAPGSSINSSVTDRMSANIGYDPMNFPSSGLE